MRYTILGVTEARDDNAAGASVPIGGPRVRALLTALALRPGRTTAPETLIDEVWAHDPPQDATGALQALVGRLRRALGKDAIAFDPGGYRLVADPDDVDLFRFERLVHEGMAALGEGDAASAARTLREALALWRGRPLADLPDRSAAARPDARYLDAVRARAEAELRLGQTHGLVPELTELAAAHPYDEPLHALLIRALRAVGRGADALVAYESVRRAIAEGLGADPGPELRRLHGELLTAANGPAGGRGAGPGPGPTAQGPPGPEPLGPADGALAASPIGSREPVPGQPVETKETGETVEWPMVEGLAAPASPAPQATQPTQPTQAAPTDPTALFTPPGPAGSGAFAGHPGPAVPAVPARPPTAAPPTGGRKPGHAGRERMGNIRPRLTSFVGREPELDAIRSEIRRARLVTLTGPGGSGKTRLAEEAAAGHPRAWLAELAPLDRPEAVPGAVVSALGLRETLLMTADRKAPQDDPVALLVDHCAQRSLLLVLDNCEHVIGAAAELAETLLTRCPGLTILATSREPLGVPGESVRPVEPLPPDPAHRLFAERASAVRPGFDPGRERAAVEEICRRLDGLPLAIELAAARLRLLTPRQIADRLDDRFRLLTNGSRTVLPRQQTLRAVVDWSWELLDEHERRVLCEVSVFAGGWDIAAAEAVCSGPAADAIGALVDKSLVVASPGDGPQDGMRYRLLETIHEYASARAREHPDWRTTAEQRHGAYFTALAQEADPLLRSGEQMFWIARLETDLDNIRAALHRAIATRDEAAACALACGMGWFWWLRNYRTEGSEWIEHILRLADGAQHPTTSPFAAGTTGDHAGTTRRTSPAPGADDTSGMPLDSLNTDETHPLHWPRMNIRLMHVFLVADYRPMDALVDDRARAYISQVRAAFAPQGPMAARFPGLVWPFTVFFLDGPDALLPALDIALANCRAYGHDWGAGVTLLFRTHASIDKLGGMAGIAPDLAELRAVSKRVGDRWLRAQVCSAAAEVAVARGHFDEARGEYEESLRLAYEVGAYAESPLLLARLAAIAYQAGDRATALKTLEEAGEAADRYGVQDAGSFVRLLFAVLALDDGETAQARALVDQAHAEPARGTPPPHLFVLLQSLEAQVTAAESGPGAGLPIMMEALRLALVSRCGETVTAGLLDSAAALLCDLGDHRRASRLLAAATAWRSGMPRSVPEEARARHVLDRVLKALGPARHETERATGAALDPDAVLAELAAALGSEPPASLSQSPRTWPPTELRPWAGARPD